MWLGLGLRHVALKLTELNQVLAGFVSLNLDLIDCD